MGETTGRYPPSRRVRGTGVHLGDGAHQAQGLVPRRAVMRPPSRPDRPQAGRRCGPGRPRWLCSPGRRGGHLRGVQGGLVGDPVAVFKVALHVQSFQQGGDLLPAPVDQDHPHPHGLQGGGVFRMVSVEAASRAEPPYLITMVRPAYRRRRAHPAGPGPCSSRPCRAGRRTRGGTAWHSLRQRGSRYTRCPASAGLRPLAGEEDHRGLVAAHHRLADGLPPVGDDGVVAALCRSTYWAMSRQMSSTGSSPASSSVRMTRSAYLPEISPKSFLRS